MAGEAARLTGDSALGSLTALRPRPESHAATQTRGRMTNARGVSTQLSDVTVIELGQGLAAGYCGRWLRLHGAHVVKLEDPAIGGDRLRREDLLPDGWRYSEDMSMFAALHAGKESVALGLGPGGDRSRLEALLAEADVVVSGLTRRELRNHGLESLLLEPPDDRIVVACTPFGLDGPYADYEATDEVTLAFGGGINAFGESQQPPEHIRVAMGDFLGGVFGFMSSMLGLWNPGAGNVFDVSSMDCVAVNLERVALFYTHLGLTHLRGEGVRRHFAGHPGGLYPSKDGWVMVAMGHNPIGMMAILVEQPELEEHPLFIDRMQRQRNPDAFDELILPWFLDHTSEEIVTRGTELTMPFGHVLSPAEVIADAQLNFRGDLVEAAFAGGARAALPGLPFRYQELDAAEQGDGVLTVPALPDSGSTS